MDSFALPLAAATFSTRSLDLRVTPAVEPILPKVAAGEPGAVAECLRRYGNLVWSLALRFTRDTRDAEDASQDVFVALWKHAAAFDPERAGEATFVAMIARRRLIDRQRSPGTRRLPVLDGEEPKTSGTFAESYVDARTAADALALCSEPQRRVITLAALQGLTHEEIARELSMPLGTVKSHYARGIERVKKSLSTKGESR